MTKQELIDHLQHLEQYTHYSEDAPALREVIKMLAETHGNTRRTHACDFCHEDSDGYVKPIEKNSHAVIYGSVLHLKAKGWSGKVQIKYCPMCGRRLER